MWLTAYIAILVGYFLNFALFQLAYPFIPLFLIDLGETPSGAIAWTGLGQTFGSLALMIANPIWGALGDRLPRQRRILGGGIRVVDAWHTYSKNLPLLVGNVAVAIVYQLVGVLMFVVLSRGLGLPIGFFDWSWIVGALTLALFLPVTVGGLGVREGTLIGILAMYGYNREMAVALSFVAFSFVLMLAVIGAALLLGARLARRRSL